MNRMLQMKSHSYLQQYRAILLLTGIIIFAFLIRFISWKLDPLLSRDAITYLEQTQSWYQSGENNPTTWVGPPLYLFLIKNLMGLGIPMVSAGIFLNLTAGALVPLVFYGIAQEVCNDRRIAFACAILCAVHPSLVTESVAFQRDTLYFLLIGISIYFFLLAIQRGKWYFWSFTGLSFPFAFFVRYEALELFPIIVGSMILAPLMNHFSWGKAFYFFAIFCLSVLLSFLLLSWVMGIGQAQCNHIFDLHRIIYERILFFRSVVPQKGIQ